MKQKMKKLLALLLVLAKRKKKVNIKEGTATLNYNGNFSINLSLYRSYNKIEFKVDDICLMHYLAIGKKDYQEKTLKKDESLVFNPGEIDVCGGEVIFFGKRKTSVSYQIEYWVLLTMFGRRERIFASLFFLFNKI